MHEAKTQLSALGKRAWGGERIVIAKAGEPYLDLLPHRESKKLRKPGRFKGKIKLADDFMATSNEVFVSSVSSWEIAIKKASGKLEAPGDIDTIVDEEGFSELPISIYHGEIAGGLPMYHKDPFDRMLIAQATVQGVQLITDDHLIQRYDVRILDPLT